MKTLRSSRLRFVVVFLLFGLAAISATAATCEALQNQKATTYGFHPAKLTAEQRQQKSAEMDKFWDAVKASGPSGTECLKAMLSSDKVDGFLPMMEHRF